MSFENNEKIFTYSDYLTWSNNERCELIHGVPYAMSHAPSRIHQELVGELFLQIGNYLKDKSCKVYVAPFDIVLIDEDNDIQSSILDKNKIFTVI